MTQHDEDVSTGTDRLDTAVAFDSVSVSFREGHPIVRDFSLSVKQGAFVVLFGTSGVGKSTLLRVAAGVHPPDTGTVRIPTIPRPDRRPVGMVFQDARLFGWRSVKRNVMFGLEGLDLSRKDREERADAMLRLVGLSAHAHKRPNQLSGGQQQRVGIARALAVQPDLLLMDEPFSALDAITRRSLQDELRHIWEQTKTTILFVTHDVEEAVLLADRIVLLAGSPASAVKKYHPEATRPRNLDDRTTVDLCRRIRSDLLAYHRDWDL